MTKRIIIALTGAAGSGKTEASRYFAANHSFHRLRFAAPLKAMLHCLGLTEEHTDGALKELPCAALGGKTPRYAMQTLGTEWGRDLIYPTLWAHAAVRQIDMVPNEINILFDDCRFPNEIAELRKLEDTTVFVIRIVRPTGIQKRRWWQIWRKVHVSETLRIEPDFIVPNDGTIAELYGRLREIVDTICKNHPQIIPLAIRIEAVAKNLYDLTPYTGAPGTSKPKWIEGGNSMVQDHMRKQAESLIGCGQCSH
jgi:hypothetical protein